MLGLFQGKQYQRQQAACQLYIKAVDQSRQPFFYGACQVPDTIDGRFDLIVLHLFLMIQQLQNDAHRDSAKLQQALFDIMFADMDQSLREMGVGDMGVPRRVKAMMQAFNGRCHAYHQGMLQGKEALIAALGRNIYRDQIPAGAAVKNLADYVFQQKAALQNYTCEDFMANQIEFMPHD